MSALVAEIVESTSPLTLAIVEDARVWLSDCVWADMDEEDFATLSPSAILAGVEMFYSGGLAQFLSDGLVTSLQ